MESVDDVLDDGDNKNDGRVVLYIRALIWSLTIFDFGHGQSPATHTAPPEPAVFVIARSNCSSRAHPVL